MQQIPEKYQHIASTAIDGGEYIRDFTRPEYAPSMQRTLPLVYERRRFHPTATVSRIQRPKNVLSHEDPAQLGERSEYALAPFATFLQ